MKTKVELRKEIAAGTTAFLQGGGVVKKIDMGRKRGQPKPPKEMTALDVSNLPASLRMKLKEWK